MSADVAAWCEKLKSEEYGQAHLVENISDERDLAKLVDQIEKADKTYPGGLINYLQRARKLLVASKNDENSYAGFTPEQPALVHPQLGSPEFWELEKSGSDLLGNCAFVLVAGGLGERLGYSDIKVALPTECVSGTIYLQHYVEYILAFQRYTARRTGKTGTKLPLAIMVSGDTAAKTRALLEAHDFFGMDRDQLFLLEQEKVPALLDNDARIATSESDKAEIDMKPHGHGDVHSLLYQADLPRKWLSQGLKYIFFFQDTNALSLRALPVLLGASEREGFLLNSLCTPRAPGEAAGAVCLLKKETGEKLTINIEYNVLGPLLKDCGLGGDVAAPGSKYSKFPGNCNCLLFEAGSYANIIEETKGSVPEFVNPKYADAEKNKFKKPTRVECMMQEFARLYKPDQKIGCTQLERCYCFSVVKNNRDDARSKLAANQPADCCYSGEAELYESNVRILEIAAKKAGVFEKLKLGPAEELTIQKLTLPFHPRLVIRPSFSCCASEMADRLATWGKFSMTSKSACVLDGPVVFDGVSLDGALVVKSKGGCQAPLLLLKNLEIKNEGFVYTEADEEKCKTLPLPEAVRGYYVDKRGESTIGF